jgi:hypothetical protein
LKHLILYVVLPFFVPVPLGAAELQVKCIRIVVDEFLDRFVVFVWGWSALVETEKSSRPLDVSRDQILRV